MTLREFRLPDLGEGLEDAEIVRWLVAVGDEVAVDQPVVEVVTAKANVELPSPYSGTVSALGYEVGAVVPVGQSLLSIEQPEDAGARGGAGESVPLLPEKPASVLTAPNSAPAPAQRAGTAPPPPPGAPGSPAREPAAPPAPPVESGNVLVGYGTRPSSRRRRASAIMRTAVAVPTEPSASAIPAVLSPVVRRLARDLGVDLTTVKGSGAEGVITRADVARASRDDAGAFAGHVEQAPSASMPEGSQAPPRRPPAPGEQRVPIRGVHRQMAELVTRSRREIPEATVWVDVDATGLLAARRDLAGTASHPGGNGVGLVSLLGRFCVVGLGRWPALNSRVEGDEVVMGPKVDLGFAAQTDRGLIVPVVHDADGLTLAELDAEIRRLASAARAGTLTRHDVTGGSFTVNNYGVFGVDGSAAIINHPEAAMIGMGRIIDRPWVVDGQVTVRPVTQLTLAFDHRVCDGGVAGGFLRFVADCVEQPLSAL
jgi:2-oxoisovalerate dehydrogenase E2 component (dihydrolipoyl transacylase)